MANGVAHSDIDTPSQRGVLRPASLVELLSYGRQSLAQVDTAWMNLLCADGLPGSEYLDREQVLATLESWLPVITEQTESRLAQNFHFIHEDYYHGSANFLRMAMIVSVTKKVFGVEANQERIAEQDIGDESSAQSKPDYKDCRDLFIHGMVAYPGNDPPNGGTCCSIPALLVVLARMLDYPVFLSTARQHTFSRWDTPEERFNVERHNSGVTFMHDDEHYLSWPKPMDDAYIRAHDALKSLDPHEELAMFLSFRAYCLEANMRFEEAIEILDYSIRLHPGCRHYSAFQGYCRNRMIVSAGRQAKIAAPASTPYLFEFLTGPF